MITKRLTTGEIEDAYDAIAEAIDSAPEALRELFLAKLALTLANQVGNLDDVKVAIEAAARDLD